MRYLALHIDAAPAGLEAVEALLAALDVPGWQVESETEFREFLEKERRYWDYVDEELQRSMAGRSRVTFYAEDAPEGYDLMARTRVALEELKEREPACAGLIMSVEGLEDEDWENNWRAWYRPIETGERLIIVPDWLEADCGTRIPVRLDPGLAFGTGSHATTRLCLETLERVVRPGDRVLDLGCGSGILFIAALLLGAESAFACDIDPRAAGAARENAGRNGLDPGRYTVRTGDVLADGPLRREMGGGYDVVTANIVADAIISLAPAVRGLLAPEGVFLCSGIIDGRQEEVRAALEGCGLAVRRADRREDWHSFLCGRKET